MNSPMFSHWQETVTDFKPHWKMQLFICMSHDQSPYSGHSLIKYRQLLIVLGLYPWMGINLFGFLESIRSKESTLVFWFCDAKHLKSTVETKSGRIKKFIWPVGSISEETRSQTWKRGPIFDCLFFNRLNGSWIRSQKHSYGFLNNSNLYNDEWKRRFPPCNDILDKYLNLVHIHSSNSICRFSFDLNKTKIVLFQGFFNTIF